MIFYCTNQYPCYLVFWRTKPMNIPTSYPIKHMILDIASSMTGAERLAFAREACDAAESILKAHKPYRFGDRSRFVDDWEADETPVIVEDWDILTSTVS